MTDSPAAMTLSNKRKRAQVSYIEEDEDLDTLLEMAEAEADVVDKDDDDADMSYGSRAKPKRKSAKRAKKSTQSKSKKATKPFPFMLLPAELRDQIYELALTDPNGISLTSKTKNFRRTVARIPLANAGDYCYGNRNRRQRRYQRYLLQAQQAQQGQQSQQSQAEIAEPRPLIPALLAVSKEVHAEAVGWLYQQPLIFEDTYALHSFLGCIGSHRSQLTDVVIRGWGSGRGANKAMNYCALTLLSTCTNLKSLFLDCELGWSVRQPRELAKQIIRDANVWLESYGALHGRKDAAVDVLELREWNFDRDHFLQSWRRPRVQLPEKDRFKERFQAELRSLLGC